MTSKTKTPNKTAFVKSLPQTMSAKEVVARGKREGLALTEMYIYSIRSRSRANGDAPKRGPGRPPSSSKGVSTVDAGSLVDEIERIVELKVNSILESRFGSLLKR